ncbi:MAG: hypothetical protein Kow0020_07250 [Wenzhouxiangellaceae bacterium]
MSLPVWACDQTYSIEPGDASRSTTSTSNHNIGRFEWDPSVNGWRIVETWHEPGLDYYEPGPNDRAWFSSDGSYALIVVVDQPGGGGGAGGGGGGGGGGGAVNSADPQQSSAKDTGEATAGCGFDEPPYPGELMVVTAGGPIGALMVGAANGWAIISRYAGGSSASGSRANPIGLGRFNACPLEATDRERAAHLQYKVRAGTFGCARNLHQGKYFELEFSNGRKGVYRGTDGECRGTHAFEEVQDPGCTGS